MIVKLCDRCGNKVDNVIPISFVIRTEILGLGIVPERDVHLCEKCMKEFKIWLSGKSFDKEEDAGLPR